jgi:hypothetical protein
MGAAIGAFLGLVIGIGLSVYVANIDARKVRAGTRKRAEYRLSLFGVPIILAVVGAAIGAAIAG